jgi:hypothetical protein
LVLWLRSGQLRLPAVSGRKRIIKNKLKNINHGSRIRITAITPAFILPFCNGENGREFRQRILALVLNRHSIAAGGQYYPALFAG